jgi:hypothetical protein
MNVRKPLLAAGLAASLSACGVGEVKPQPTPNSVSVSAAPEVTEPCADPKQREIYTGHFAVRFTLPAGEIVNQAEAVKVTDEAARTIWSYSLPGSLALKAYNLEAGSIVSHVTASGTQEQYEAAVASGPDNLTDPMWLLVQTENQAILDTTLRFPAPRPRYTSMSEIASTRKVPHLPEATKDQGYVGVSVTANEACSVPSVDPSSL